MNGVFKTNVLAKLFADEGFKPLHEPVNGVFSFKPEGCKQAIDEIASDCELHLAPTVM